MNKLNNIRIESTEPGKFRVWIDDHEVYGLTELTLEFGVNQFTEAKLSFLPGTVQTNEIPTDVLGVRKDEAG